jgi:hypothetical protein
MALRVVAGICGSSRKANDTVFFEQPASVAMMLMVIGGGMA